MKIKKRVLQEYLNNHKMSVSEFAQEVGVNVSEIEKMLSDIAVEENVARIFINYFGVDDARHYIDWTAMNKTDPFADEVGCGE